MANHHQSFREFSDASIRRFLLGQLDANEQTTFEEELFRNSELETRVRLAELELADDYAFRLLTDAEAERFLVTAGRNQQVQVSNAIRERLAHASVRENVVAYYWLAALRNLRRPAWRYAFAALILLFILTTVVLVTKEPQIVRRIIQGPFRPRPQPAGTPQVTHHGTNASSPAHVEQRQLEPPHESPLVVVLNSATNAEQAPVVNLPPGEKAVVRFRLSVEAGKTRVYRAELLASSGERLFITEALKPYDSKPPAIDFDVPASALKSGQYLIRLTRVDDPRQPQVSQYYFRVK
jgi:hypothetical protein